MTVSHGKPYAGKPHVRFDEGAGVPGKGRSALLHDLEWWSSGAADLPRQFHFCIHFDPLDILRGA